MFPDMMDLNGNLETMGLHVPAVFVLPVGRGGGFNGVDHRSHKDGVFCDDRKITQILHNSSCMHVHLCISVSAPTLPILSSLPCESSG